MYEQECLLHQKPIIRKPIHPAPFLLTSYLDPEPYAPQIMLLLST